MTTQKLEEKISPSTSQPTTCVRHCGPLVIKPGQSRSEAITDLIKHLKKGFDHVDVRKPTYDELLLRTYSLEKECAEHIFYLEKLSSQSLSSQETSDERLQDLLYDLEIAEKTAEKMSQKIKRLEGQLLIEQMTEQRPEPDLSCLSSHPLIDQGLYIG